jgi:hypothetical protein
MDDPILDLLHKEAITQGDIDNVCVQFDPVEAEDVEIAFTLLEALKRYSTETETWSFSLLGSYDFDSEARQFDLDLAVVVGKRAEFLLDEIHSWDVNALKEKVYRLPAFHSDWATVLTMLVLRIVSQYSKLEFKLQLALSRSTLIKIHYELNGLVGKVSPEVSAANPLVAKYKSFVKQLLAEIETTPFENVQQEMFQVVRDLQHMFVKFASSQSGHNADSRWIPYAGEDDELKEFADSGASFMKMSPRDYGWTDDSHLESRHKRTVSSSQFSSATGTTKTSITEDMPSMLLAFDAAKAEEVKLTSLLHTDTDHDSLPQTKRTAGLSHASVAGSRCSVKTRSSLSSMRSPTAQRRSLSSARARSPFNSTIQTRTASTKVRSKVRDAAEYQNLQVKMVDNRMIVKVGDKYADLQDWVSKANSTSPPRVEIASSFLKMAPKVPTQAASAPSDKSSQTPLSAGFLAQQQAPLPTYPVLNELKKNAAMSTVFKTPTTMPGMPSTNWIRSMLGGIPDGNPSSGDA